VFGRVRRRGIERTASAAAAGRLRGVSIDRAASRALQRRLEALRKAAVTLRAHDPERTLERGYALAETADGAPITTADAAVAATEVRLRFADGRVKAEIEGEIEREAR
jgi:exodeoxyribonuclease VII large subunit